MAVNENVINLRRTYKTRAHAEAMQSIGACLNGKPRVFDVQKVSPSELPVDVEAERESWQEKALTQTQQDVVGGILIMLEEMQGTAQQINIQAAAFGLKLPPLVLYEAASYHGEVMEMIFAARLAAEKTGAAVILDRLLKRKEMNDLRARIGA